MFNINYICPRGVGGLFQAQTITFYSSAVRAGGPSLVKPEILSGEAGLALWKDSTWPLVNSPHEERETVSGGGLEGGAGCLSHFPPGFGDSWCQVYVYDNTGRCRKCIDF